MNRPRRSCGTVGLVALLVSVCIAGRLTAQPDTGREGSRTSRAEAFDPGLSPGRRVHREILPNGLVVLIAEDRRTPLVAVRMTYRVGSADEEPGRTGLAHLLEHAMFLGSENFGPGEHDRIAEGFGARVNAVTDRDETAYFATATPEALETLLVLEADRMARLRIDPGRFQTEKGVVLVERRQKLESVPYELGRGEVTSTLFDGDPYGWPVLGRREDLLRVTAADLREFYRRHYGPNRAVLTIGGAVETESCLELVRRHFADLAPIPFARRPVPGGGDRPPVFAAGSSEYQFHDLPIGELCIGFVGPSSDDPDFAAVEMLAEVLVQGPRSRLRARLVESEQLARSVSLQHDWARRSEPLLIKVEVLDGVDDRAVRSLVFEELERLASEGPDPEELEEAVLTRSARMAREKGQRLLWRVEMLAQSEVLCGRDPDYLFDLPRRFLEVRPADLSRVLRRFLDPAQSVSVFAGRRPR